jgi:hypothetical protein
VHKQDLTAGVTVSASVEGQVERSLNDTRLAVLGILVTIALAVGFGVSASWPIKLAAAVGAFLLACLLIRAPWSRKRLMSFMYWLTGR